MAETVNITRAGSAGGRSYNAGVTIQADSVSGFDKNASVNPVPAAETGVLTTRTSASVGEITMDDPGHSVTTGDFLSLFFEDGSRRNVVAGTVAGAVVPFSLGDGDDLPAEDAAVTVAVAVEEAINLPTGADLLALLAKADLPTSGFRWHIVLKTAGDVEVLNVELAGSGNAYVWDSESGVASPIGTAVTKATVAHEDTTAGRGCSVFGYRS